MPFLNTRTETEPGWCSPAFGAQTRDVTCAMSRTRTVLLRRTMSMSVSTVSTDANVITGVPAQFGTLGFTKQEAPRIQNK